jgi:hypothetical protein
MAILEIFFYFTLISCLKIVSNLDPEEGNAYTWKPNKQQPYYSNNYYNNSNYNEYIETQVNKTDLYLKYDSDNLNSIELTSNSIFNYLYLEKCKKLTCKCCTGNINNLSCLKDDECSKLSNNMKKRIAFISLGVYCLVLFIFAVSLGLVMYYLSIKVKGSFTAKMNGLYSFFIVMSVGTILPGIVVVILKFCFGKNIQTCFNADFYGITNKYLISVDVRDEYDNSNSRYSSSTNNKKSNNTNTNRPLNFNNNNNAQYTSRENDNDLQMNVKAVKIYGAHVIGKDSRNVSEAN